MLMRDAAMVPPKPVRRLDWQAFLDRHGPPLALLALVLFNAAVTPNFLSWQTLNVNLTQVCTTVIVGVGMTLVIATGGIDLSVGSLMAISGALAPLILTLGRPSGRTFDPKPPEGSDVAGASSTAIAEAP